VFAFLFLCTMAFAFEGNLGLNRCVRADPGGTPNNLNYTPKWLQVRQGKVPLPKGTVTIPIRFGKAASSLPAPPAPVAIPETKTKPQLVSPAPPAPHAPPTPPKKTLAPPVTPATPPSDLWTERFRGKRVSDIIGHETVIASLRTWIRQRLDATTRGNTPLVAFLSGPPGTGKTTLSYAVLAEAGLLVEEVNASEERSEAGIWDKLTKIPLTRSMVTKNAVGLILDEIDGGTEGTLKALEKFLKLYTETDTAVAPIICIANSLENKSLREFARKKKYCLDLRVSVLPPKSMRLVAERAITTMGQSTTAQPLLGTIIQASNGDARKLLNLLQQGFSQMNQLNLAVGDPFCNLFQMTQLILSRNPPPPRIQYALMEQESEMATLMLQHNYLGGVSSTNLSELETLAQVFSDADVLEHAWDAAFWSPEEYTNVMVVEALRGRGMSSSNYTRTEFPMQYFQMRSAKRPSEPMDEDFWGDGGARKKTKKRGYGSPPTDDEKVALLMKAYPHSIRYAKVIENRDGNSLVDFRINY